MNNQNKKSITTRILINIGLRIALVIVTSTLIAYYHTVKNIEESTLNQLDEYVSERGKRESVIFDQCSASLLVMKQQYLEKFNKSKLSDPNKRFDELFTLFEDGVTRSRLEIYDGMKEAAVFIGPDINITDDIRREVLVSYDIVSFYGRAFHPLGIETMLISPDNIMTVHWPNNPAIIHNTKATYNYYTDLPYVTMSSKQNNPDRIVKWTRLYYGPVAKQWLMHVSLPVDIDGNHEVTLSRLITLNTVFDRMTTDHLNGTYNVIMRKDGQLNAHPDYMEKIREHKGPLMVQDSSDQHLKNTYHTIIGDKIPGYNNVYYNEKNDEYIAVSIIEKPNWYFMSILPKGIIRARALPVAFMIFLLGFISLVLEVCILYYILKKQVSKPLEEFEAIADKMAEGDYNTRVNTIRNDELGRMGTSFNHMAIAVDERDSKLEGYANELENRVKQRTSELEETQEKLIEASRKAGMSQVATSVLHKIGNLINSANISVYAVDETINATQINTIKQITDKLIENKNKYGKYIEDQECGEKLLSILSEYDKYLIENKTKISTELARAIQFLDSIKIAVSEQQEFADTKNITFETTLEKICNDLSTHNHFSNYTNIELINNVHNDTKFTVDTFKVISIINLVYQHITSILPDSKIKITLNAHLDKKTDNATLKIEHDTIGCIPGQEMELFKESHTNDIKKSLHTPALLATELNGNLTAISLGENLGMVYAIQFPITTNKNINIAA